MTKILLWGLGLLGLLIVVGVAGLLLLAADTARDVDFGKPLLTDRPNQYLACPEGFCADKPGEVAPVFDVPPEKLLAAWDRVMAAEPRTMSLPQKSPDRRSYEQRSKLLRYPDRITVQAVPMDDGKSSIAIYSQSKYGYSDAGVNETRVKRLLSRLKAELGG